LAVPVLRARPSPRHRTSWIAQAHTRVTATNVLDTTVHISVQYWPSAKIQVHFDPGSQILGLKILAYSYILLYRNFLGKSDLRCGKISPKISDPSTGPALYETSHNTVPRYAS
jgi:hypothetical protein